MNKVYVRTRSALVLFRRYFFFFFLRVARFTCCRFQFRTQRCLGLRERETRKNKKKNTKRISEKSEPNLTREKSLMESLSRLAKKAFRVGRTFTGRRMDNRAQFLASLLWSGFTPSSSSFLPPSSGVPPLAPVPGPSAANLIEPQLRGKRLT